MATIGKVSAVFTASTSGLVGAVNDAAASLGSMRDANVGAGNSANALAERSRSANSALRDAAKIAKDVQTPAEAYAATVNKLNTYLQRGLLTQDVYSRAIQKAKAEMDAAAKSSSKQAQSLSAYAKVATTTERVVNGLSGAIKSVGDATKSVADAGSSVLSFAADIAKATAAWRIYQAVIGNLKSPTGLMAIALGVGQTITVVRVAQVALGALGLEVDGVADFAVKATLAFGAFKAATAAGVTTAGVAAFGTRMNQTLGITNALRLALLRVGVSAATTSTIFASLGSAGTVVGSALARVAAFSVPGFGQIAAATYLSAKAMIASRDRAYENAAAVAQLSEEARKLGTNFQNFSIQKSLDAGVAREDILRLGLAISEIDSTALDNLAYSAELSSAASAKSQMAVGALGNTVASTFTGLFAGVSAGSASLTESFASIVGGINSIAAPIAAVLRPFGTVIGTVAEAAMKTVAIVGEFVGVSLRLAGAITQVALSPFIVGLTNVADAIKVGVGGAFEWLMGIVSGLNKYIDATLARLQQLPVIGRAFATSAGGVAKAAQEAAAVVPAATAEATSKESLAAIREEEAAMQSLTNAIGREEQALSNAIAASAEFGSAGFDAAVKYQEQLRALERQLEAGILNETSFADAAGAAKDQFQSQISDIKRRNEEEAKAKAQADAAAAAAEAAMRPSTAALKATDSRSKEGVAEMLRLMRGGGQDVQERQLEVLEMIHDDLSEGDVEEIGVFAGA
jgi:hypothetical protein